VAALDPVERELNATPGSFKPDGLWERYGQPGGLAVDSVSWWDCREWLQRLNRWLVDHWAEQGGMGTAPVMMLPSESQWEAACRGGSEQAMPFHFGEVLDPSWANVDGNYTYGAGRKGEYRQRPMATGAFGLVNHWGLAEMHGQLSEWCGDQWHVDPIGPGWPQDGSPWEEPDPALEGSGQQVHQLLRGGSWFGGPRLCRTAFRNGDHPGIVYTLVGVRPCCLLPPGFPS
jgi:formylglycine-generating enzyme required for sulfatase activity